MKDLSSVLNNVSKGNGSMAKLMNDKDLYINLEASTKSKSPSSGFEIES